MEIASKYNPAEVEGKWYQYWLDNGFFKSKPDGREPYTIVIPPPNVTGDCTWDICLTIRSKISWFAVPV